MKWEEGLLQLASIAQKANIKWWTTGKILLPLNGIDAEIDDLDFYFDKSDLDAVCDVFKDCIIEPIVQGGSRTPTFGYNGKLFLNCEICMFSEPNANIDVPDTTHFGPYAAANLMTVNWNGYEIKVPPIELYIKTLENWGKIEFAKRIKNALQHTV